MPAKITDPIPVDSLSLVRDQIASILLIELAEQNILHPDEDLSINIFADRNKTINQGELPLMNISVDTGDFINKTHKDTDSKYKFFIDLYTLGATSGDPNDYRDKGYYKSASQIIRFIGLIRAILHSEHYLRLDLPAGIIKRTRLTGFRKQDPNETTIGDAQYATYARLIFEVELQETVQGLLPTALSGFDTEVKIENTDKGYKFTLNNS